MNTTTRPLLQTSVAVTRQGGPRREGEARPARPALTRPLRGPDDGKGDVSYAIYELDIARASASIERVRTSAGVGWRIRCERCGNCSKPRQLISSLLTIQHHHAQTHVAADVEEMSRLLDAEIAARPQTMHRDVHSLAPVRLGVQPRDRVHLAEPQRKVS